jgi:hypothetical protein
MPTRLMEAPATGFSAPRTNHSRKAAARQTSSARPEAQGASRVSAEFVDSLASLLSALCDAIPKGDHGMETIVIRGDKVFIRSNNRQLPTEGKGTGEHFETFTTSRLNIVSLSDGHVVETLDTVLQVKTPTGSWY